MKPLCRVRHCSAARLMNPGFEAWLYVFHMVRDELMVGTGMAQKILEDIGWTDHDSLSLLHRMHVRFKNEVADWQKAELEKKRREAKK